MRRFCVIGSFTGRNAGDSAILENLAREIAEYFPDAVCEVPTINPKFIRETYPGLPLEPVATLPWNLSVKSFGLPVLLSVARCDAVLITQAILFDKKFWNPLYNYLSTLMLALPLACMLGKKIFYYGVGVGPVTTTKGRVVVRKLLEMADGITLREEASVGIMEALGVHKPHVLAADTALNQMVSEETTAFMRKKVEGDLGAGPYVALNLNAYIADWTHRADAKGVDRNRFISEIVRFVRVITDEWKHKVIMICTHHMDEAVMEEVLEGADRPGLAALYKCRHYDHRMLTAAMGMSEMMIGMRLHCQILAMSAGTPCVALNYAPKVRHFMEMAGMAEYVVEIDGDFSCEKVLAGAVQLRDGRDKIMPGFTARIDRLKEDARKTPAELARVMGQC